MIIILATIIALPIGRAGERNDGTIIFAQLENLTTWPQGWTFMLAWLSPIWTIGAFDSCVHMSEEASNAAKAVPLGILSSIGMCWGLGFVLVIVLAACMDPNVENVLGSEYGQPVRFGWPFPRNNAGELTHVHRWPRSTTTLSVNTAPWDSQPSSSLSSI